MHIVHDPNSPAAELILFGDFAKVDIRLGTVSECQAFPEVRNPSYILMIDFGGIIGLRKSAAQVTVRYSPSDLIGRQVMAVVNFPPRQTGPVRSEVLVLGFADANGAIAIASTASDIPNGARLA